MATPVEAPSPPLISTKLDPPVARELVSRRELLDRLGTPRRRKLTLVRAPAGWGKSTLLADWHASPGETRPFAWLAVDRGDNDAVRFWTYLIEALRKLDTGIGRSSLVLLRAPGVSLADHVLPVFLNELASLSDEVVLVLDDYHLITNSEIHEGMAFVIEHLPAALHIVVSTRSEPPLRLARLRASGDLTDIDAEALSFSATEAAALLNDLHGLGLDTDDVARLCERTEGWAAGLYLAALTLRSQPDPHAFIEAFAGDDRLVVDYLVTEVLAGQPGEVRSFLLQTSVLDRLCAPLCDAVTNSVGSARMLGQIERSNSFLIPLDARREWYRYHHLFGELLRLELSVVEPELVPELHRRAARWLLAAGSISAGIRHTTAAGDVDEAGELITRHWLDFRDQHRLETVLAWLDALPREAVAGDPRLCLVRASTLLEVGRAAEAEQWLDAAERGAAGGTLLAGPATVDSGVAAYRAIIEYVQGDVGRTRDTARPTLERGETDSGYWRSALFTVFGASVLLGGETRDAVAPLDDAVRLGEQSGHTLALTHALGWSAAAHAELSEWDRVNRSLARVDVLLRERPELGEYFGTALAHVVRGKLLARYGRLTEADDAMSRGVELARRGGSRLQAAYGLLARVDVKHDLREHAAAAELAGEARQELERCPDPGALAELLADAERRLGRGPHPHRGSPRDGGDLSDRELAVLRLLATELSQRDIGRELYVSLNTVKTHTKSIFRKLGVSTRATAVARARELGLL